jgi:hypothetical protein
MTLALRRTVFLDGERRPDDYEVRYNGWTVGRILRLRSTGREMWKWTQIDWGPTCTGPNGGVADTFDDAKAAFRRTWDAYGAFGGAADPQEQQPGGAPKSIPLRPQTVGW